MKKAVKIIIELLIILLLLGCMFIIFKDKIAAYYYNRADSFGETGMYKEAIDNFKISLKLKPDVALVHYGLGNVFFKMNQFDEAAKEYNSAITLDNKFILGFKALANTYVKSGKYRQALDLLEKALSLDSSNKEISQLVDYVKEEYSAYLLNEATSIYLIGNKPGAQALAGKAVALKPDFSFSYYTLAYFSYSEKDYNQAEAYLKRALELDVNFYMAYRLLGDVYFDRGVYEKAVAEYVKALEIKKDGKVYNNLGLALMNLEKITEAVPYLEKAAKLEKDNSNILYALASIYRDKGEINQAAAKYQELISRYPGYPNVHNDLADIFKQQGRKKEALKEYEIQAQIDESKLIGSPDNYILLTSLAYAYNGLGRQQKAKEIIEGVINSHPNYRKARLTLAKIYDELGQKEEALRQFEKAKNLSSSAEFIKEDINRIREDLGAQDYPRSFAGQDTIIFKSGRKLHGVIKERSPEKVIIELGQDSPIGTVSFDMKDIEKIESRNKN